MSSQNNNENRITAATEYLSNLNIRDCKKSVIYNMLLCATVGGTLSLIFLRKLKSGIAFGAGIGAGYMHEDFITTFNFLNLRPARWEI